MRRPMWGVVVVWAGSIAAAIVVGGRVEGDRDLGLGAAPFAGRWERLPLPTLLPALAVAVVVVTFGPTVARRARWRTVVAATGLTATVWASALAVSQGRDRLTAPLTTRHEYEPYAAHIPSARTFLRRYVAEQPALPIHVKGHPPGATLIPWVLDRVALGGAGWLALLALLGWGVAAAAVLVAGRRYAPEDRVRDVAPAVALLPAAVWAGTSMDALFAGILAVSIAVGLAPQRRRAIAGGALMGAALLATYGGAVLLLIPGGAHLRLRRPGTGIAVAAAALGVLVLANAATGFWWFDGLAGTRRAYWDGAAGLRPTGYSVLLGNTAVLATAIGPAVAVGLVLAVRGWRLGVSFLPLAALGCVALADASLLSKGEVERIWLPFVPWLALAVPSRSRWWLVAQAAVALAVQGLLRSPW